MDAGSYNGPMMLSWVPAGYTSYERHTAGWLDYSTLNDNYRSIVIATEQSGYCLYHSLMRCNMKRILTA